MITAAFAPERENCSRPTASKWWGKAADAISGIEAAHALRPDVVLLDVQLPDLDGIQASKRIGAMNGSAIILISSCDITDLGSELADSPALGFIPKSELSGEALWKLLA